MVGREEERERREGGREGMEGEREYYSEMVLHNSDHWCFD